MDITPHVNLLKSLRGKRIDYILLVGEGLDNAFDAGATEVRVSIGQEEIRFHDNGRGVNKERIDSLFSLGKHGAMTTTALGRFGIGIKAQAVNAGNVFSVDSTSIEGRVKILVDWTEVLRGGRWQIDDPRWLPAVVGGSTGTVIAISQLRKPPPITLEKITEDIERRFYPGIAEGRRIILNGAPVQLLAEPPMTAIIEQQLPLSRGRNAHIRAGVLASPSKLNRVHVGFKHRIIMPASTFGCGEYGGLNKMFARVNLSGPWHLAEFKDDLTDEEERNELEQAVADALNPILEQCNKASMSARLNDYQVALNERLPSDLVAARPRQQKHGVQPSERKKRKIGGLVDESKTIADNGPAKTRRSQSKLLITFEGNREEHGVGEFQVGRPSRVNLSPDDPFVAKLIEHRDRDVGVWSLYALAICLFEQGRDKGLFEETFGQRIAKLLATQKDADDLRVIGTAE